MDESQNRKAAALVLAAFATAAALFAFNLPIDTLDATATEARICTLGYAHAHRNVPYHVRDRVYNRYGLPRGQRRGYVIDHRVPLELGGTNAEDNLFPQSRAEARRKDKDENRLHDEVCSGRVSLRAARAEIARLWAR